MTRRSACDKLYSVAEIKPSKKKIIYLTIKNISKKCLTKENDFDIINKLSLERKKSKAITKIKKVKKCLTKTKHFDILNKLSLERNDRKQQIRTLKTEQYINHPEDFQKRFSDKFSKTYEQLLKNSNG